MPEKLSYDELVKKNKHLEETLSIYKHEEKKYSQRHNFQRDLAAELSTKSTLEGAIRVILTNIFLLEEFDSGGIYLLNKENKDLEFISHIGLPQEFVEKIKYYPADDIRTQMLMKGNLIYMATSEAPEPIKKDLEMDGILGLTVVPLKFGKKVIGSINLASHSHAIISDFSKDILESVSEIGVGATIYRVSVESALWKSEGKFRRIFDHLQDGYLWADSDGNILLANKVAADILGYDLKELMQKNMAKDFYFVPEDRETVKKIMFKYGKIQNFEVPFRKKDGQKIIVEINSHIVYDDNNRPTMEGTFRDITFREQAEEDRVALEKELRQAHKMESIGILAGGIAHDFNNILSIIIGNVELVLNDMQYSNPAFKNIKEIKIASNRAKDVVKQLLSFSRKSDQDWEVIDFVPILKESLTLVRSSMPSSIEIHQNMPDSSLNILADVTQIHQVIINLCTNASHSILDAERFGVIDIHLKKTLLQQNKEEKFIDMELGNYLELIIKDNGSGIDSDVIDKIFDPYFTTKDIGKGTGMGLAVVHGIVKDHNGTIFVESQKGLGTEFHLFFPITEKQPEQIKESPNEQILTGTEKILFVDDEDAITNMAKNMLTKLGYHVEVCTSSKDALKLFKNNPKEFDLLISDMTMPSMNGLELSKEIKKIKPELPIVICTGHSSLINEDVAKENGISALMIKPISMAELSKIIWNIFNSPMHKYKQ